LPAVFEWLQEKGCVETEEMYRTFNCGAGMVICVSEDNAENAISKLTELGEKAWVIGSIEPCSDATPKVILN